MENKQKILFLKGLPASGKSTFAKELVASEPDKWVRVNKDSLRNLLHDGKWSSGREKTVQKVEQGMVEAFLKDGYSVVIDNTHFASKHERTFRQVAEKFQVDFEVKFFDTSVETCIERDRKREKPVGKDVILNMYYTYLCAETPKYDSSLLNVYIVDIDGTLALHKHRNPFEWDKVSTDELNQPVFDVVDALAESNKIIIVSGRDSCCRALTEKWLYENQIYYLELFMRPEGNSEKDTIIKKRIYEEHIKGKYNILGVFDDRPSVVRMWRAQGLFVFDCGKGVEF